MKLVRYLLKQRRIKISLFFILFVISRVFFINASGVFFDSQEYIDIFSKPSYIEAIISGHYPPHVGYNFLFWPFFHLTQFLHGEGAYGVILAQIIFGFITLYCFYEVIAYVTDKKIALYAAIIASLTPLFWIINVTLMDESAYAFYFFTSLYLLILYLKKNKSLFLHLSLIFYGMALITLAMTALWAPVYLFIVFIKKKKLLLKIFLYMCSYFVLFSVMNLLFIACISKESFQYVTYYYYLSKVNEFTPINPTFNGILIAGRNFLIPLLRNYTILLMVLSLISLLALFKKNKTVFFFGLLWILPAIYTNQWWDSLLNGRHALITGFGVAFLVAYLMRKKSTFFSLTIIYILICSLPALNLLRYPIPYLSEASYVKSLPENSLLIESHFARPQVQDTVRANIIYLNEPERTSEKVKSAVDEYLAKKKLVFISSAALSEPYGLYSGPYIHNITLSYAKPFTLQFALSHYSFKLYKTLNEKDNLMMYQITSDKNGYYPKVPRLTNSYRRIDYTDPLSIFYRWIESTIFH